MLRDFTIITDTREQKPWFTDAKVISFEDYKIEFGFDDKQKWLDYINSFCPDGYKFGSLMTGDYSIQGMEDKFTLERKSIIDLYGTLGKGHKRFKKELQRALELDYFAIIVEGTYTQVKKKLFPEAEYSKMSGDVVSKIVNTIHIKYGINIFFCDGVMEAKTLAKDLMMTFIKNKR